MGKIKEIMESYEANCLEKNLITYDNAVMYRGYRIFHSSNGWLKKFEFVSDDYDGPGDHRLGSADSLEEAIIEINELEIFLND